MSTRPLPEPDRVAIVELCRRCELIRPWNDPHRDIDRKLAVDADGFLVGECDEAVVGSVMAGYDGHRGRINDLAADPARRGRDHAAALVTAAEGILRARGVRR